MIDAGDMSADITSEIVNVINLDKASIHIAWTGSTPVGELKVDARNGENDPWYELDFNTTLSVSGNSGDSQIVFNELPFTDIRLRYVRTSGTGSVDATISMKVVGA